MVVHNRTLWGIWQGIERGVGVPGCVIGVSCSCEISDFIGDRGRLEGEKFPPEAQLLCWLNIRCAGLYLGLCWFSITRGIQMLI